MLCNRVELNAPRLPVSAAARETGVAGAGMAAEPRRTRWSDAAFDALVEEHRTALLQVFVARYGVDAGAEATAAALAWAWEHRESLDGHPNLVGYLYRVGQSSLRKRWDWNRRRVAAFPAESAASSGSTDTSVAHGIDLAHALQTLGSNQRTAVLLVHAHGWSYSDVAVALGVSVAAVTNHVHRGMRKLRRILEEGHE